MEDLWGGPAEYIISSKVMLFPCILNCDFPSHNLIALGHVHLALMEDTSPEVQVQHVMARASKDSKNPSSLPGKGEGTGWRMWQSTENGWLGNAIGCCLTLLHVVLGGYSPNTLLGLLLQDLNQFVIRIPSEEKWAEPWWWKDFKGSHVRISSFLVVVYQWPCRES